MMTDFALMRSLATTNDSKIVMLVLDGLGGMPMEPGGSTELEAANTPNLNKLARAGACGLSTPIRPGVSPGSGPAHLSLFSYDPLQYEIGRGVLEAVGIGFDLQPHDLAARGNFATVDEGGLITDRRAGRISTEECERLCAALQANTGLDGYEVFVEPVREHRFVLVIRGEGLSAALTETDPLQVGRPPLPVEPQEDSKQARRAAELVNRWIEQARAILEDEPQANSLNLRGFATDPSLPQLPDIYKLRAGAIAVYPMYRGVAKLVGMEVLEAGSTIADEFSALEKHWTDYDFFFLHVKYTDSRGEDGDFEAKSRVIEEVDQLMPRLLALNPTVVIVTGDHSTPAKLCSHSWHPVPTLLWGPAVMPDYCQTFGERECAFAGGLGHFHATDLLPLAMGHAERLARYGA